MNSDLRQQRGIKRHEMLLIVVPFLVAGLLFLPGLVRGKVLAPLDILTELCEPWASEGRHAGVPVAQRDIRVHNHFTSDAVSQYLIYRQLMAESLRDTGGVAHQPYILGGYDMRRNTMATPWDWTVQLHRFLGFWEAWHLGLWLQFGLAGTGMAWFLHSRGMPVPVALLGGVAYLFNSQFIVWIYHRWALGSFCWVPWMLWAMLRFRDGSRPHGWAVPCFMALAFLGGSLQHAAFVVLAVAAVWLGWLWEDAEKRGAWKGTTRCCIVWGFGGVALASFMFVPCIAGFLENTNEGRGAIGYETGLAQPFFHLAGYAANYVPWLLGSPGTVDLNKLFRSDWFNVAYIGTIPALLGTLALFHRSAPKPARVLGCMGLLLPLTPLVGPLYHRVLLLYVFGAVWAFAWVWSRAPRDADARRLRWAAWAWVLLLAAGLAVSVGLEAGREKLAEHVAPAIVERAAEGQFGMHRAWLEQRAQRFLDESRIWAPDKAVPMGWLALGLAALWLRQRGRAWAASLLLLLVVAGEASGVARKWLTWSERPSSGVLPPSAFMERVRQEARGVRVQFTQPAGQPPFAPPNTPAAYGIRMVDGYESIRPPERHDESRYHIIRFPGEFLSEDAPSDPPPTTKRQTGHTP